jgi:hypothetical protein
MPGAAVPLYVPTKWSIERAPNIGQVDVHPIRALHGIEFEIPRPPKRRRPEAVGHTL